LNGKNFLLAVLYHARYFLIASIGLLIGFIFGAGIEALTLHDKYRTEAIEHGYAQHNPVTGEWEWKDK